MISHNRACSLITSFLRIYHVGRYHIYHTVVWFPGPWSHVVHYKQSNTENQCQGQDEKVTELVLNEQNSLHIFEHTKHNFDNCMSDLSRDGNMVKFFDGQWMKWSNLSIYPWQHYGKCSSCEELWEMSVCPMTFDTDRVQRQQSIDQHENAMSSF